MPRLSKTRKLSRQELHDVAVRRRGDSDVQTLLWEIRRLHGVLVQAHELTAPIHAALPDLTARETVLRGLTDLLEAEPAVDRQGASGAGKPQRPPVTGYTERRLEQVQAEAERDAKRRARRERG